MYYQESIIKRESVEHSIVLHQMYSESNVTSWLKTRDQLMTITLLLPRGKWRLRAL